MDKSWTRPRRGQGRRLRVPGTLLILLTSFMLSSHVIKAQEDQSDLAEFIKVGNDEGGSLLYRVMKASRKCRKVAEPGDDVTLHYEMRVDDRKGKVFESSRDRGETFTFEVGSDEVIKGYSLGIAGMCQGEVRELVIPPSLAYGEDGMFGNVNLYYVIEVVNIIKDTSKIRPKPQQQQHSSKSEL